MTYTAILEVQPYRNLREEYRIHQSLFDSQPLRIRNLISHQGGRVAQAIIEQARQVSFSLPDAVLSGDAEHMLDVASRYHEQTVNLFPFACHWDVQGAFISKLVHLEQSKDIGLAYCASLMRFSVAWSMVHQLLPDGRPVCYRCEEGDEIPSLPQDVLPGIRNNTKAGKAASHQSRESGAKQEEDQSPYPRAAMGFFLPQWVAFGDEDQLLVRTTEDAEAKIHSMQKFMNVLNTATAIAPYMVADDVFQRKRTGILGELVNQGRALGRYEIRALIAAIQRRVKANSLNRGLSLEITYFDDQELEMKSFLLEVIPAGRIMFVPAFIVQAVWQAYLQITQDTSLNSTTRKHLLSLLAELENAFLE